MIGLGLHNVDVCMFGDVHGQVGLTCSLCKQLLTFLAYYFCILASYPGSASQRI